MDPSDFSDTAHVATGIDPTSSGASVDESAALFDAIESQQGHSDRREPRRPAASDDDRREPGRKIDTRTDDRAEDLNDGAPATGDEDTDDEWPEDLRDRKFRRTIGGERIEVTLAELERGHLRQSDYTRKMMEIAQHRSAFEQGTRATLAQREQLDQSLRAAHTLLQASMPQEPNWAELAVNADPRMLQLARIEWEGQQRKLAQVAQAIQANQQAGQHEFQQMSAARLQESFDKMLELNPDWRDPKVRAQGQKEIGEYITERGFTTDELRGITDPRIIGILRDAAKYRAAVKTMESRRRQGNNGNESEVDRGRRIQPATPGPVQSRQQQRSRAADQRFDRLRKTGKLDDAAAVFADLER